MVSRQGPRCPEVTTHEPPGEIIFGRYLLDQAVGGPWKVVLPIFDGPFFGEMIHSTAEVLYLDPEVWWLSVLACTLKQQKRQGLCQEFTQATIFNVDLSANREPENKMVWGIHHFWTNPNHMWFVIACSFQLLSS